MDGGAQEPTPGSAKAPGKDKGPMKYRGRLVIWPGIIVLLVIVVLSIALITSYAVQARKAMLLRRDERQNQLRAKHVIGDNEDIGNGELVSADGAVGNPTVYPQQNCVLPNYVSKDGKFFAQGPNGESVQLAIKGINWFGMETKLGLPFGLWTNDMNGTTVYEVAFFLSKNNFNSVRLPLSISSILTNSPPLKSVINQNLNRAIDVSTYISTISSLVQSLAYRNISVLLDLHTLTPSVNGGWPWSPGTPYTKDDYLDAVDVLTKALCNNAHWNVIGVDAKNEPYLSTWGDGGASDFHLMVQIIGNRVLKGCPKWLVFVEGISAAQKLKIGSKTYTFSDWWGGGLEGAGTSPVVLDLPSKVVYSPHYYTPAVYPQLYFLESGTVSGDIILNYVELDDDTLMSRVKATTDHMFGYLAGTQDAAIIPGEFGGLYTQDAHPKKTTQRVTQCMMEILKQPGFAGGYMWALNPESAYQYNPSDKVSTEHEGVLQSNWLDVNNPLLQAMTAMDSIPHVRPFPCFLEKK